jgi:membrane-associated phospholipid phosphatase
MKPTIGLFVLFAVATPYRAVGQTPEPGQIPPGSPTTPPPPAPLASPASAPDSDRPVSWKLLLPNLISDQKNIWTFPVRLAQGKNWIPTAAVLGTATGLAAVDPAEGAYFRQTSTFQGFNNIFTSNATAIGTIAAPVSLYAIGLLRKDSKMERTALLAGEAVADAEIVTSFLKNATRRVRPAGIAVNGNFWDSWYESGGGPLLSGNGSFPSGHTIAAFSVATVIARRYGNHHWVPYAAYGLAALVGFSRLSLSSHFLSDVFMGGALGYSISRFTVLRQ